MGWFKIEDVAKETGLTKRTIRYYEEIGLISPSKRSDSGIRLYTQEDVERIKKVLVAKEVLGFSLQELQQFLQLHQTVEQYRSNYGTPSGKENRRAELAAIAEGVKKEMEMIEVKIEKMQRFKQELAELYQKVQECLE